MCGFADIPILGRERARVAGCHGQRQDVGPGRHGLDRDGDNSVARVDVATRRLVGKVDVGIALRTDPDIRESR